MNASLTLMFIFFWVNEVSLRIQSGDEYAWLFIEGLIVILCGIYWTIQDFKEIK